MIRLNTIIIVIALALTLILLVAVVVVVVAIEWNDPEIFERDSNSLP